MSVNLNDSLSEFDRIYFFQKSVRPNHESKAHKVTDETKQRITTISQLCLKL